MDNVNDEVNVHISQSVESEVVVFLPNKPNNSQVSLDPTNYDSAYRILIKFLQNHFMNRALTLTDPSVTEEFDQEFWYSVNVYDNGKSLKGDFDLPNSEYACEVKITRDRIERLFQLPTLADLHFDEYEPNPTSDVLVNLLEHIGYNHAIHKVSEFKRQYLPRIRNVLVSILNKGLTCKLGSMDQASTNIITLMYGIFFNRPLDYAELIYQEIKAVVVKKVGAQQKGSHLPSLMYTRFIPLLLRNAIIVKEIQCNPPFCKFHKMQTHDPPFLVMDI